LGCCRGTKKRVSEIIPAISNEALTFDNSIFGHPVSKYFLAMIEQEEPSGSM